MKKQCFKCSRWLSLDGFYAHPRMADGHLNKCKECTQADTIQNRHRRIDHYREYDRQRPALPHRIQRRKDYLRSRNACQSHKRKARTMAGNALRDGRLHREPCHFCGSKTNLEMHHPDYHQPLRVYWLCRICHRKLDGMTKIGIEDSVEC